MILFGTDSLNIFTWLIVTSTLPLKIWNQMIFHNEQHYTHAPRRFKYWTGITFFSLQAWTCTIFLERFQYSRHTCEIMYFSCYLEFLSHLYSAGTGCPEKLWSLLLDDPKAAWTWACTPCSGCHRLSYRVGPNDLQMSLPTSVMLWFFMISAPWAKI